MLPTKGYFQDIECPYYNSSCGRPYCHFRHRKKPTEIIEENIPGPQKSAVPTYKPTPKSELANIQNSRSHIPISYVPDLAFRPDRERTVRPIPKFEKPTYKPTPLSILSSAKQTGYSLDENEEHTETIKDIKQNIANNEYDPSKSEINFEDLSNEFDLIDEIIHEDEEPITGEKEEKCEEHDVEVLEKINKIRSDIEKTKISVTKTEEKSDKSSDKDTRDKTSKSSNDKRNKSSKKADKSRSMEKLSESSSVKNKSREKHKQYSSKEKAQEKSSEKSSSKSKEKSSSSKERSSKDKDSNQKSHKSSSRDKHRKEEKKETSKEKHKSKEKIKDKDRSRSKEKDRSRSRSISKQREKDKDQSKKKHHDKHKSKSKDKHKSGTSNKRKRSKERKTSDTSDERKKEKHGKPSYSFSESSSDNNDNDYQPIVPEDINVEEEISDIDDEDETMRECYRIFSEYKPEPIRYVPEAPQKPNNLTETTCDDLTFNRKRTAHPGIETTTTYSQIHRPVKPKTIHAPGQTLTERYRIAKLAAASREQENIMKEISDIVQQPVKRAAPSLLEAARQHKIRRSQQVQEKPKINLIDDILNGTSKPSISSKIIPKKINAVPNVALMQKAKERISKITQKPTTIKTIAQTQKSGRIAHLPEFNLAEIPDVLQADKSKLPVNVRTRFLTMIADECVKLYLSREEAYTRALNEEFACYEKCKVLATYRNSSMLAVNRLRKEISERESKGLGPLDFGESSDTGKGSEMKGKRFYNYVKKWILTEDELDIHGYPRESGERGRAVISNRKVKNDYSIVDENQRKCSRCSRVYQVDDDGWPLDEEECMYHPLKKRTIRGEQVHLCCKSTDDDGCVTSDTHVHDGTEKYQLEGFQTTMEPEMKDDPRSYSVYALDCEMCYTTQGLELTRVTIVDTECKTVYESLVKPLNPIIDYNTRFSGITKDQMDKTSTSILQIQANILHLCNSRTILMGHSLESDLKALKIVHRTVIDTSVLFPHKMGLPHKKALRSLASEYLKKIIQNDVSGHDSAEDAITCMELIKWKMKEELKVGGK